MSTNQSFILIVLQKKGTRLNLSKKEVQWKKDQIVSLKFKKLNTNSKM